MESQPSTFEYRFNKGSSAENIPFELNANKPYLQVRINGAGPYWFILDTGSVSTVVDTELAKMLEIAWYTFTFHSVPGSFPLRFHGPLARPGSGRPRTPGGVRKRAAR